MSRSLWKTPFSALRLKKRNAQIAREHIWSRASTILPEDLGKQVYVHNGKTWVRVHVVEQMIAHKYGEFASTRKKTFYKSKSSRVTGLKSRPLQQNSRKK